LNFVLAFLKNGRFGGFLSLLLSFPAVMLFLGIEGNRPMEKFSASRPASHMVQQTIQ